MTVTVLLSCSGAALKRLVTVDLSMLLVRRPTTLIPLLFVLAVYLCCWLLALLALRLFEHGVLTVSVLAASG